MGQGPDTIGFCRETLDDVASTRNIWGKGRVEDEFEGASTRHMRCLLASAGSMMSMRMKSRVTMKTTTRRRISFVEFTWNPSKRCGAAREHEQSGGLSQSPAHAGLAGPSLGAGQNARELIRNKTKRARLATKARTSSTLICSLRANGTETQTCHRESK